MITQKANVKSTVKHLMRQIAARSNPQLGYQSVEEVDADLSSLLLQGYRIVNTHYLGVKTDPNTGLEFFGLLYVLQLEQVEIERMKLNLKTKLEKSLEKESEETEKVE